MSLLNRPSALLGGTLTLLGCASTHDLERANRREEVLYGSRARAESPAQALPDDAALADYLEFGLKNSADLRAAFEDWRAATERIEQVSALPDPRLSYGEFIEEVQTRTGPQERRIGLSQALPWPGRLGQQARVAERQAEASWQRVEAARLVVAADIEVAFQDYAFLARELQITEELVRLLRGLEPVVQARITAGRGQEDILRLQVEIGRLEDDLASVLRRRAALSARLADAVSLQRPGDVLPFPALREPVPRTIDVASSRERALAENPGVRELQEHVEASRAAEKLAAYHRRPTLGVGVDYVQTGGAVGAPVAGSGDDPILLGLSMTLPIWTASYSAAEREARHTLRASQERLDSLRSSLGARVEEEAYRIDDATRKIALYRDSLIPRASEALDLTLASYRAGEASILDLIDSERALLEFELSFWRACRDYLQGAARLRAITAGDPL